MMKEKKYKHSVFSDKTDGLLNFADLKKKRFRLLYWCMFAILILLSLICILPIIWVFLSGFKDMKEMYKIPPTLLPEKIDFGNVFAVCSKINVLRYFKNSVLIILGCVAVDITVNGLCGYVLSRLKPTGSKIVDNLIFWSMLLPGISMIPLYMTFVDLPLVHANMIGSYAPIWLMSGCSAFNVLLFKNFFNGIPISYIEAARIDGCTDFGIFGRIILPLSKPIIVVVAIFCVTGQWGNFMWPYLILGNTEKEPVAVMLYSINQFGALKQNEYMLLLMVSIVPVFIVFAIFSKQIMGGVNMSGLKG